MHWATYPIILFCVALAAFLAYFGYDFYQFKKRQKESPHLHLYNKKMLAKCLLELNENKEALFFFFGKYLNAAKNKTGSNDEMENDILKLVSLRKIYLVSQIKQWISSLIQNPDPINATLTANFIKFFIAEGDISWNDLGFNEAKLNSIVRSCLIDHGIENIYSTKKEEKTN